MQDRRGRNPWPPPTAFYPSLLGAGTFIAWPAGGTLAMPLRGRILLWGIAIVVLGLSVAESLAQFLRRRV